MWERTCPEPKIEGSTHDRKLLQRELPKAKLQMEKTNYNNSTDYNLINNNMHQ